MTDASLKNPRRAMGAWLALGVVLWSAGGHTSQVFFRTVALQDLVRDADVIVLAEPATPSTTTTTVDITPTGEKPDVKRWPPWQRHTERWVVRDVLLDESRFGLQPDPASPPLAPGVTIGVDSAVADNELWLHRAYYVDGMSESPIHDRYQRATATTTTTTTTTARILILRRAGAGFSYVMIDASEFVENRAAVEGGIRLRRGTGSARPTITPVPVPSPAPKKPQP